MRITSVVILGVGARNAFWRQVLSHGVPSGAQLSLIHLDPPLDEFALGWRQLAAHHLAVLDVEPGLAFPMVGVDMRRRMVVEEHADGDAMKEGYRRHPYPVTRLR